MVEKGRHAKPKIDINKRYCQFCKNDMVENEYHFIFECTLYKDYRTELFNNIVEIYPNFS